ncbi:hypothetical protein H632_c77p0 [Helicosporidium sp. ATCC 50920]|nr:hypothetical protein H632_c77p0 [Helicosporidium sp. ATCC 50920]|eukprot:KDD76885.1 hypothetical protein H632_c77p0 [Helicosporidium sp. ATCC 50920]
MTPFTVRAVAMVIIVTAILAPQLVLADKYRPRLGHRRLASSFAESRMEGKDIRSGADSASDGLSGFAVTMAAGTGASASEGNVQLDLMGDDQTVSHDLENSVAGNNLNSGAMLSGAITPERSIVSMANQATVNGQSVESLQDHRVENRV